MEFDPFDYEFHRDPTRRTSGCASSAPVYHNQRIGFWALSRFDDVLAGPARPRDLHVDRWRGAIEHTDSALKSMIELDPPRPHAMRKLIARRFTPRRVADLEPRVREWTSAPARFARRPRRVRHRRRSSRRCCPRRSSAPCSGSRLDRHDDARRWTDDLLTREPGNPVPPPAAAEGAMNIGAARAASSAGPGERSRPTTSSARWSTPRSTACPSPTSR